jgi:hypothetical protein
MVCAPNCASAVHLVCVPLRLRDACFLTCSDMQAARFHEGKFQQEMSLQDASAILELCEDAAMAARRVPTEVGPVATLARQWHALPPLLAAAAAFWIKAASVRVNGDVLVAAGLLSSTAVPLSLIAAGTMLSAGRPSRLHLGAASSLLSVRAACAFGAGGFLLLLTPQVLAYAMPSAALLLCMVSAVPFKVLCCLTICLPSCTACAVGGGGLGFGLLCSMC